MGMVRSLGITVYGIDEKPYKENPNICRQPNDIGWTVINKAISEISKSQNSDKPYTDIFIGGVNFINKKVSKNQKTISQVYARIIEQECKDLEISIKVHAEAESRSFLSALFFGARESAREARFIANSAKRLDLTIQNDDIRKLDVVCRKEHKERLSLLYYSRMKITPNFITPEVLEDIDIKKVEKKKLYWMSRLHDPRGYIFEFLALVLSFPGCSSIKNKLSNGR
jgi:hypothetical protein